MLSLGAKWADIPRGLVDQPMPNHFVFPFKPLAAFGTITGLDRTVVGSILGMDIHVRALIMLSMKSWKSHQTHLTHFSKYCV